MRIISRQIISLLLTLLFITTTSNFSTAKADDFSSSSEIEKITYVEDADEQESIDEELFGEESEYEEYDVYTEVPDDEEEDTTQMIILAPDEQQLKKSNTILQASVEKSYSFRAVEAFNTIWDNSANFRTTFMTLPSMKETAPSIIHAANYRFKTDENTSIYWGHASLSSQDDISVGFVGKLESSYDTGLKINTKIGGLNVSSAIYDSLETNNPAGGVVVSSDELKIKGLKGSLKLGGGFYSNECGDETASANSTGFFARYKNGRFSLGAQVGKTQYASSKGRYGTSVYLYPEFRLTNAWTLKTKLANHIDQNYMQEQIGLTYKPTKNNPNEFSVSVNASLYNGEGTTTKQRVQLSTEFKL